MCVWAIIRLVISVGNPILDYQPSSAICMPPAFAFFKNICLLFSSFLLCYTSPPIHIAVSSIVLLYYSGMPTAIVTDYQCYFQKFEIGGV